LTCRTVTNSITVLSMVEANTLAKVCALQELSS
jgi:hypothetical protein